LHQVELGPGGLGASWCFFSRALDLAGYVKPPRPEKRFPWDFRSYHGTFHKLNRKMPKMKTNEILTLQALKFKKELLAGASDLPSDAPAWMANAEPGGDNIRNICALISIPLFDEVERLCGVLRMSKRRFVELALRDFAEKANQTIDDVGLTNVSVTSMGQIPVDEA
jgi:hypothetical protein